MTELLGNGLETSFESKILSFSLLPANCAPTFNFPQLLWSFSTHTPAAKCGIYTVETTNMEVSIPSIYFRPSYPSLDPSIKHLLHRFQDAARTHLPPSEWKLCLLFSLKSLIFITAFISLVSNCQSTRKILIALVSCPSWFYLLSHLGMKLRKLTYSTKYDHLSSAKRYWPPHGVCSHDDWERWCHSAQKVSKGVAINL